jgi:hypothetical protein
MHISYEQKYLKYKKKYIILKNQYGAARLYSEMPLNISISDYRNLPQDELLYYDNTNEKTDVSAIGLTIKYYSKRTLEEVNNIIRENQLKEQNDIVNKQRRLNQIRDTPNISISEEEYYNLPRDHYGYEWIPATNPYQGITGYRKGKTFIELARIEHVLNQERKKILLKNRITSDEYYKLNNDQQLLYQVDLINVSDMDDYYFNKI